jgi:hypothetical protein
MVVPKTTVSNPWNYKCDLIWKKGLCECGLNQGFQIKEIVLLYPGGPNMPLHVSLQERSGGRFDTHRRGTGKLTTRAEVRAV